MKQPFVLFFSIITAISLLTTQTYAMDVRYPKPKLAHDTRYAYHIELLKLSLEKTKEEYGLSNVIPAQKDMNELRLVKILIQGGEDIDVIFKPTSKELEKKLTPVRIPLDKGLLGWRIFLIKKENQAKFSAIKTFDEFKTLTVGQARDWGDVAIYEHNGIKVVKGSNYKNLFPMLLTGRFDYFARGVEEAPAEWKTRREKMPDLHIEKSIVLHYPFVRYFWVANSAKGDILRERISKGLEIMIKDGSYENTFMKFKKNTLEKINLSNRIIFELENPFLPDTVELNRTELWYKPIK